MTAALVSPDKKRKNGGVLKNQLQRDDFWRFSQVFYNAPKVATTCLWLQDEYGANINLILYGCWRAIHFNAYLDKLDWRCLRDVVEPWNIEVVGSIRGARRRAKPKPGPGGSLGLYNELKIAERAAERRAQSIIFRAGKKIPGANGLAKTADVVRLSLEAYLTGLQDIDPSKITNAITLLASQADQYPRPIV